MLIPKVLDLMVTGQLQPEKVITQLASLDDAPMALKRHVFGDVTKTVLVE
jgi:Zn-dependent alcohol dehydrogenase